MTVDFIKKNKGNIICQESEKVFIVYKYIETPIDALIAGM
jgi:hypothetical protein